MDVATIVKLLSTGGWGVAAIFAVAWLSERKNSSKRDDQIFTLLQKQLKLLGSGDDKES